MASNRDEEAPEKETEDTPLLGKAMSPRAGAEAESELNKLYIGVMLAGLVMFGVIGGMVIEGWQFLTSLYVIVQIVTTVGYGDFTVHNDGMKLFCAFYVILMLVFGAYAFNYVFDWVKDHSMDLPRKKMKALQDHLGGNSFISQRKEYQELMGASFFAVLAVAFGTIFYATYEACTCSYGKSHVEGCKIDTYEQCVATGGYVKTWIGAFYMSVITLTTVGFGDHSPRSRLGRIVGIVWMLAGVGFMAHWFSVLTKTFLEREKKRTIQVHHHLSRHMFDTMDKDGSGSLSREEFLVYFLMKNGLVSHEDVELINQHFSHLDVSKTDRVTWEEIKDHM